MSSKEYRNKYMREYYKTHKNQMAKWNKNAEYKRLQRYRERIYNYQMNQGGCEMCGNLPTRQRNLDFHHIDPNTKFFGLADGYKYSWKEVLLEINKCMILCKSCHNIIEPRKDRYGFQK